ncbi:MAG TPA: polysaccharide deacetylase family protein [Chthonomonadaceae bacterium]|nr:polysaccharide deacetylase family protein [Chthonomonadaceae bacterium]
MKHRTSLALAACVLPALLAGCGRSNPIEQRANAQIRPTLTAAQLAQARPNEAGVVPILMYHDIGKPAQRLNRSVAAFRHDLERLYQDGYRPISLEAYLDSRIDLPLGKSPVILTFDDARGSQFHYRKDGTLDPDCAIGILQAFGKTHPDFPLHATFFVLPNRAFDQHKLAAQKLQDLLAMGCEIGNHTVTHRSLKKLSDEEVQQELATCVTLIHKMVPQARVDTMALPYGILPHNQALLASGTYQGQPYTNRAVLLVGAGPAPSPVSPQFDPMHLPRIVTSEVRYGMTYWLNDLKRHPERRYVSDGDPGTVTVPRTLAADVDKARLKGVALRLYDLPRDEARR